MAGRIANETELIEEFLTPLTLGRREALGLADDAAVLSPAPGSDLVISTDPIISGVHFFPDDRPEDIGWKALAVNLSDLAAKAAEPVAYTMALAFPEPPLRDWLHRFTNGLREAQQMSGCALIGGDTDLTPGPLSIAITAFGTVPAGKIVPRGGASGGDKVFVSGTIGDSALGLELRRNADAFAMSGGLSEHLKAFLIGRYLRPSPRLELRQILRKHATGAIDISDGLAKDLTKLIGNCGLSFAFADVPLSEAARAVSSAHEKTRALIATGGGDYEIAFSVASADVDAVRKTARSSNVPITELGTLTASTKGLFIAGKDGRDVTAGAVGYDHFAKL